jgi:hypothetical protein
VREIFAAAKYLRRVLVMIAGRPIMFAEALMIFAFRFIEVAGRV